jgi:hypothetical protein
MSWTAFASGVTACRMVACRFQSVTGTICAQQMHFCAGSLQGTERIRAETELLATPKIPNVCAFLAALIIRYAGGGWSRAQQTWVLFRIRIDRSVLAPTIA